MSKAQYEQFFYQADQDGDGYLSFDEFKDMLRKHGHRGSDKSIMNYFIAVNTSGFQRITLDEFLIAMGQKFISRPREVLARRIFRAFDRDGNGEIEQKEFKALFAEVGRVLSEKEAQRMVALMDRNCSGTVNFQEFLLHFYGEPDEDEKQRVVVSQPRMSAEITNAEPTEDVLEIDDVEATQVEPTQDQPLQDGSESDDVEVEAAQVEATQVEATQVEATQMAPPANDSTQDDVEMTQVDTSQEEKVEEDDAFSEIKEVIITLVEGDPGSDPAREDETFAEDPLAPQPLSEAGQDQEGDDSPAAEVTQKRGPSPREEEAGSTQDDQTDPQATPGDASPSDRDSLQH